MKLFEGRKLIIATKHKKESVIAPILEKELGVHCFTDTSFDTDSLGTFSGEVRREQNPLSTARTKCLEAMNRTNCDLGLASEGSFGPHPTLFFASADDEQLIFIDKKNNLEITSRELSLETNFNATSVRTKRALLDFATRVKFPSHAIILKPSKDQTSDMVKGIQTEHLLLSSFKALLSKYKKVYAETDMRAMFNPSRMAVIRLATKKLATKIRSVCPNCETPGFDITDIETGLACMLCGNPTKTTKMLIYQCQKCDYSEKKAPTHGKISEDPMYCDYCNP